MALTRKLLKSFSLEESVIDSIIEAHTETVDALKKQRDEAQAKADQADELTRQLNEANDKLTKAGDSAKVQKEFDDYKAGIEAEKTAAKKRGAMDALLKDQVGIKRDSARKLIMDAMDFGAYELDGDRIRDAQTVADALRQTHAEWIGEEKTAGVPPVNPPTGGGSGMTRDEIMKIADPTERRQAIAKNLTLFERKE